MAQRSRSPIQWGTIAFVPLSGGHWAIIDTEDIPLVDGYYWQGKPSGGTVYAQRSERDGSRETVKMHRQILGLPPLTPQVDHIDRNGWNNRRSNLRTVTAAQNTANAGPQRNSSTGYKGVTARPKRGVWEASIMIEGRTHYLGRFDSAEDAAKAHDSAALEAWGEYAYQNFPGGQRAASPE